MRPDRRRDATGATTGTGTIPARPPTLALLTQLTLLALVPAVLLGALTTPSGSAAAGPWPGLSVASLAVASLSAAAAGAVLVHLLTRVAPVGAVPPSAVRAVTAGRRHPPSRSVDPDRPRGSRPRAPGRRPA